MLSTEDEEVNLIEIISTMAARGQVEKWLVELETIMRKSVRHEVLQAILAYPTKPRNIWALEWPGQTILCVGKTYWTLRIEESMQSGVQGLKNYLDQCQRELNEIILLIRGKLSKQNRITLGDYRVSFLSVPMQNVTTYIYDRAEALVTLDVHGKDVLEHLYLDAVIKNTDFRWLCHLRYYWMVSSS